MNEFKQTRLLASMLSNEGLHVIPPDERRLDEIEQDRWNMCVYIVRKFNKIKKEEEKWNNLVSAAKVWTNHMDQWEKFKFQTDFGTVYVSITLQTEYPDSFDEVE